MQRTSFAGQQCPLARSLDYVGEWWSIVVLRDAFHGLSRFDEFQQSLGIAPNMLSRRLKALVKSGLLRRRPYQHRPTRYAYVLTARGRDFLPVILALVAWGNRHLAREGVAVEVCDRATGKSVRPVIVDSRTRKLLTADTISLMAGPAAGARIRARVARVADRGLGAAAPMAGSPRRAPAKPRQRRAASLGPRA
jgi:DNA-binding HxlR family transcriptional regulator